MLVFPPGMPVKDRLLVLDSKIERLVRLHEQGGLSPSNAINLKALKKQQNELRGPWPEASSTYVSKD